MLLVQLPSPSRQMCQLIVRTRRPQGCRRYSLSCSIHLHRIVVTCIKNNNNTNDMNSYVIFNTTMSRRRRRVITETMNLESAYQIVKQTLVRDIFSQLKCSSSTFRLCTLPH